MICRVRVQRTVVRMTLGILLVVPILLGTGCGSGGGGGNPAANTADTQTPDGDTGGTIGDGGDTGGTTGDTGGTTGDGDDTGGTTGDGGDTGGGSGDGGGTTGDGGGGGGGTGNTEPDFVGPVIKVSVKESGIYKLVPDDLKNAGWDTTGVDPKKIKMAYLGVEIPIQVQGEDDGALDAADSVLFYGTAIDRDSSQFEVTDTNVYWIGAGATDGLRIPARDGTPGSGTPPTTFKNSIHTEQDTYYTQVIPNGEGKDHWFWGGEIRPPKTLSYTFSLSNISSTKKDCTVRYYLQGKTDDVLNPDHHTKIYLNGVVIDDQSWDGFSQLNRTVSVTDCKLVNGTNTLKLETVGDTGALVDSVLFNWFEVDYWDTYTAEGSVLAFNGTGSGGVDFSVTGFSASDIRVYDVTNATKPARITNVRIEVVGSQYKVKFRDTVNTRNEYLALASGQFKKPSTLTLDVASSLKSPENGADYIIIAHESLLNSMKPLADHRKGQGLRIITANVTDVYDEFGYGLEDPQAIKDFLQYAYENWQSPAPLYVLLVGDANLDYKDNFKTGVRNLVPTHLAETYLLGQTASDNWFVAVSGDDPLPDMFIGRISVKTAAGADAVVSKILSYEKTVQTGWNKNVQFVADNPDEGGDFEAASEDLIGLLPSGMNPIRVYSSQVGSSAESKIISNINAGALITNYTGHGDVGNWAAQPTMFTSNSVSSLSNSGKPTFVITLNCLNGFFNDPFEGSVDHETPMAEAFVNAANKGAIAAWSPTGLGFTFEHDSLAQELFDAIFNQGDPIIGSVTTRSKISAYTNFGVSEDVLETFVLFGDPATKLAVP